METVFSRADRALRACRSAGAATALALLAACSTTASRDSVYQHERFESTETHLRSLDAPTVQVCEAARRALLSQGYLIVQALREQVIARKSFQPDPEVHMELQFNVACAPDGRTGRSSLAFATAVQDRYTLKKAANSASLGVGALGSLSVPLTASDESMVKVGSETISSSAFYERFFVLVERFLSDADPEAVEAPAPSAPTTGQ
ncbi:DUF2242 domain-containing protein [Caldimonas sp. KR1-144]|uniref:DUF2242 domain-containing protein n=1 Tax=Caldimonas sp. KR1-144 TaxID=3400911 RepID=UPI003BFEA13F